MVFSGLIERGGFRPAVWIAQSCFWRLSWPTIELVVGSLPRKYQMLHICMIWVQNRQKSTWWMWESCPSEARLNDGPTCAFAPKPNNGTSHSKGRKTSTIPNIIIIEERCRLTTHRYISSAKAAPTRTKEASVRKQSDEFIRALHC